MNPLTNMKNVTKLSERELGNAGKSSWHDQYKDSAWIFVGGLPYDLTEGDIVCIFSQYGEIVQVNLIRDKDTGKSRGFCFLCYEDQRSAILAVDNFNGIKLLNRTIRVDHVAEYKVPKNKEAKNSEGCAPKAVTAAVVEIKSKTPPRDFRETIADQIEADIKLPSRLPIVPIKKEKMDDEEGSVRVKRERSCDRESDAKSKSKKSKKKHKSKSKSRSGSGEEDKSDRKRKKKKSSTF